MNNESVYELIRFAFYDAKPQLADDINEVYGELAAHGIASLMSDVLSELPLDETLKKKWVAHIVRQAYIYMFIINEQEKLMHLMDESNIPFIILKGAAAAKYYPNPINRSMGDIDLLVKPEQFDMACEMFNKTGFKLLNDITPYERHARYEKNGIVYELHRFFASMNDVQAAQALDSALIKGIDNRNIYELDGKKFPVLPDFENGLVLLQHVNQHLENGLGLRQIIDWMMYVEAYLDDEAWQKFGSVAEKIGLKKLAETLTLMCRKYLGMRADITWCNDADEALCDTLMDYIMQHSKLRKVQVGDNNHTIGILSKRRSVAQWFKFLQHNGMVHWKLAKYPVFRPFAWLYQIIRYLGKGIARKQSFSSLKYEFKESRRRTELFEALGVKCLSKGLTFRDGDRFIIRKQDFKH